MKLGAFSISLAVKDIHASKSFYEALGFTPLGGAVEQNWLILKNENAVIGLFQGMFPQNIITFNPGWDQAAMPVDPFDDVRMIQASLQTAGIPIDQPADPTTQGPAFISITDPDGNQLLIDQHR
jgi:lactoylglutathione lyase